MVLDQNQPSDIVDSAAELTTHQSTHGEWSFRFRSSDGRIVASGDGYRTEEDMKRGIEEARQFCVSRRLT